MRNALTYRGAKRNMVRELAKMQGKKLRDLWPKYIELGKKKRK